MPAPCQHMSIQSTQQANRMDITGPPRPSAAAALLCRLNWHVLAWCWHASMSKYIISWPSRPNIFKICCLGLQGQILVPSIWYGIWYGMVWYGMVYGMVHDLGRLSAPGAPPGVHWGRLGPTLDRFGPTLSHLGSAGAPLGPPWANWASRGGHELSSTMPAHKNKPPGILQRIFRIFRIPRKRCQAGPVRPWVHPAPGVRMT